MWLYLTSEVVLFAMLLAGYAIFRATQVSSVNLVKDALGIVLVTANTFVLLLSSYSMVMGLRAIRMGNRSGFYKWIGATALLGTVFLGGQYVEYSELGHLDISLNKQDFTVATNIFEHVNHVEVVLADGETLDIREEVLAEDAQIAHYHVDFNEDEELFADVDYGSHVIQYSDDFILLDASNAPVTDDDAIESELAAIETELAANGIAERRRGFVPLSRLAVQTVDGEVVPLSAIVAGQAVDLDPAQSANLNAYFRAIIGDAASGYGMRFYTPTAFHGAHVAIGVLWALFVLWRGRKGAYDNNAIGLELFGLYWHFVDVVWIVLFTLIYLV
jgi:heme/copper-type cytochrome/quinol oxidase subunit 3